MTIVTTYNTEKYESKFTQIDTTFKGQYLKENQSLKRTAIIKQTYIHK